MAIVHCKGCGAIYRYEKEGCCPRCGAYNRPPKRERVNADGTVQHMTDADYEKRRGASGKVCFEEKECYEAKECHEHKECYEEQGRQYRTGTQNTGKSGTWIDAGQQQVQAAAAAQQRTGVRRRSGKPSAGAVIAIVMVGISVISTISNVLSGDDRPSDWDDSYVTELDQSEWEMSDCDIEADMGETVTLSDGTTLCVSGMSWNSIERTYTVATKRSYPGDMTAEERMQSDDWLTPDGLYCHGDGYYVVDCTTYADGKYTFKTESDALLPDYIGFFWEGETAAESIRISLDW